MKAIISMINQSEKTNDVSENSYSKTLLTYKFKKIINLLNIDKQIL
jgi:hypothetical protein